MSTDTKHHAYLVEGEEVSSVVLKELEKKFQFVIAGNPDVYIVNKESFGIDDARALKERASLRPLGDRKFLIVFSRFITHQAQNSLLKLFEEPPEGTFLFLCGIPRKVLLPTLQSRFMFLEIEAGGTTKEHEAKKFLKLSSDERLKYIAQFLEGEEGNKSAFLVLLSGIEKELKNTLLADPGNAQSAKNLEELLTLKRFASGPSPSLKMIGEYVALAISK